MVEVLDAAEVVVEVVGGVVVAEVELVHVVLDRLAIGPLEGLAAPPGTALPLVLEPNLVLDLLVVGLSGLRLVSADEELRGVVVLVQLVHTFDGGFVTLEGASTIVGSLLRRKPVIDLQRLDRLDGILGTTEHSRTQYILIATE